MISQENLLKAAVLGHMPDDVLREAGADPELLEGLVDEPGRLDEVLKRFLERSSPESVSWLMYKIMSRRNKRLESRLFSSPVLKDWMDKNREILNEACLGSDGGLSFVLKICSLTGKAIRPGVEHS